MPCLNAQPANSKQADVDRIFGAFNTHTPGCAVGVSQNGQVALTAGYGMADLERAVPINPDTVFESGSVAKQFTAMALLLLAQQGKISLDDPLRKYLPELPDYGAPLTVRHILSHTGGLREWRLVARFSGTPEGTYVLDNQDLFRIAAKQRALNFDPGTAYSYTNTGFNIATILLERALNNGTTFQEFTRKAIFEPLGMTHTQWRDDIRAIVPNRALAYAPKAAGWTQATPIENIFGAGGMLSTVGDWLRWNENFTHAKVGGPEVVKQQETPATLTHGKTIGYAAGLVVNKVDGLREVSHGGATGGYRTWLGRYPEKAVSVAVLCNSAQANPVLLGRETARLWTGSVPAPKPVPAVVDLPTLEKLAGMFRNLRDNSVAEFRVRDNKLVLGNFALVPLNSTEFSLGQSKYRFQNDRLIEVTADGDVTYERVEPAHPSAAELSALAGQYTSPEIGNNPLAFTAHAAQLSLVIGSAPPIRLRPTFRDAFEFGGTSILFRRGPSGQVTGLSIGDGRAWDIRLTRITVP